MPPPNTPEEGVVTLASQLVHTQHSTSSVAAEASQPRTAVVKMDYQAVEYVEPVDETLLCPICKTAFHSPITTQCGHTFCAKCINRALERQRVCPIDRQPIDKARDYHPIPLIIKEQLDRLQVKCPNRGCDHVCARENLEAHYERNCNFTLVRCPDRSCNKLIARHCSSLEHDCMHRVIHCDYCLQEVPFVDVDAHWEKECEGATTPCPECDAPVINHRLPAHVNTDCPEARTQCKWHEAGCKVADKRRIVQEHEQSGCMFEAVGRLLEQRAEDRKIISDLTFRLTSLEVARDRRRERRERRRESTDTVGAAAPSDTTADNALADISGLTLPGSTTLGNQAWESPENYMLAQFERLEAQMEELRELIGDMDARQSASFLRHTKQVNDQFLELYDKVGVLTMHTKWLMNIQYMQRFSQHRAAEATVAGPSNMGMSGHAGAGEGGGGGAKQGSSSDHGVRYHGESRRNSDGRVETLTRL